MTCARFDVMGRNPKFKMTEQYSANVEKPAARE